MTSERLSGIILLIGSVLFIMAAFMPISSVFTEPVPEKRLAIINAAPDSWRLAQVFFGSGAVVAAIGLFVAYLFLRGKHASAASLIAFLLALIGALLWGWHTYLRAMDPEAFARGSLQLRWLAGAYFILTPAALFAFGIAIRRARYTRWLGWLNIGAAIVFILELIVSGDMIPLLYYVITAITAIVFIMEGEWHVNSTPTNA